MYKNFMPYSIVSKKALKMLFMVLLLSIGFANAQNAIVTENGLTGTAQNIWDVNANADTAINGFGTDISVNRGNSISFKIDVPHVIGETNKTFSIKIYRIGYYNGAGARLIADLGNFTGIKQSACGYDAVTGLLDCGNWTVATSWAVPATAVSGLYIARLSRAAGGGGDGNSAHIPFVVRNDASTADLFFQTSDATWQAYNPYGGNSLYVGAGLPNNHAAKVSYNRPFMTRKGGGGGGAAEDWFMNAEYPMIRFLESNGFDMSYTSNVDVARAGSTLLNHKAFISTGHDEYWSKEQRDNVEAARNAGKHMAFFSGNEVYWKTRWENSTDGSNTAYRTLVCYKEGTLPTPQENACGGKCDPTTAWTGLWRDGCSFPGGNACKPENALTGQISWDGNTGTMVVPDTYKNLRFWRNTNITSLGMGQSATLTNGTLGYEWDWEQYSNTYPSGRITMSSTTFDGHTHKLSMYKHASGAWVFGAGTVQWAWGLDANHDRGNDPADARMQQATINLFADMGIQPATIRPGLTVTSASTDVIAPTSVITSPVNGAQLPQNSPVTIIGTATDAGGGVVAGVEVSVDGGTTWQVATGTTNWSFTWTPTVQGAVIIKSRGFDDSGNMETPGGSEGSANTISVTITAPVPPTGCPCTIFTPAQVPAVAETNQRDNTTGIELGVKFRSTADGYISAIRFYKSSSDNALNTVQLWSNDGNMLGSATLTGTPTAGWNEVSFASPIAITANTTYVASYFSPTGYYSATEGIFNTEVVRGPLTGIATDDVDGPNGLYFYTGAVAFPTNAYNAASYWVDVKYIPLSSGPDATPPLVSFTAPGNGASSVNVNSYVAATFNEPIDAATISTATFELRDASNNLIPATVSYSSDSRTATLIPSSSLDFATTYTATIRGGGTDPRVKDVAGNALAANYTWSFTTGAQPPIPPDEGSGGPVLVISSVSNPFSRYPVEILRAQGYNGFNAKDITEVRSTPAVLNSYDIIILGQIPVNATDVTNLTNWVNAGGTLITFRPSTLLFPLLGLNAVGSTLSDKYLLVNTAVGQPGAGIVNQTIQYHGPADLYTMLAGTTSLGTLYSTASTATANPAITTRNVGASGGKAIAFSYDLARSIVYTRQGNPAYAGLSRDGQSGPIRSDNLFYPDYLDFDKVAIPQADEQQHLLTNMMLQGNLHRKPMAHLWMLPRGLKAAVVMTGDDHGSGNTVGRFNQYLTLGPNTAAAVSDWTAIRGTSYIFTGTNITNSQVSNFQTQGFEIALHPQNGCTNFTAVSLNNVISSQRTQLMAQLPSLITPVTNRTHCMPWNDWATHAKVENANAIRFDANYYYWPGAWIQDRPGVFTGSGMPMRFADLDGSIIDVYQAPTQITDESGVNISNHINSLLDKAIGPEGYYGAFVMNMHTDTALHTGSTTIVNAAIARNIPVISAKQMLTWLDTRNNTVFGPMTWSNSELSFTITTSAVNLQAMVPVLSASGSLLQVKQNGTPITYTIQTIKGIQYAFFAAATNSYIAVYSGASLPVELTDFKATPKKTDVLLTWKTQSEQNNKGFEVQRSKDGFTWAPIGFVKGAGESASTLNYEYTDKDLTPGLYYYRLRQIDFDDKFKYSPVVSATITGDGEMMLYQNFPNPFAQTTTIRFDLPKASKVKLSIYDVHGREIKVLVDDVKQAGTHTVDFKSKSVGSGLYYYRLTTEDGTAVRKMVIE